MKKIAVVFLAMTIITLFAACKKEEKPDDETTTLAPTTSASTTTETTTEVPEVDEMTYILTTNADKTVPWEKTTRFETSAVSTTMPEETTSGQFSEVDLTTGVIDVPVVITDTVTTEKITNEPPTAPEDFTNVTAEKEDKTTTEEETTEKDTTKKPVKETTTTEKTTTAPVKKTAKGLAIDAVYENGDGGIVIEVTPDGWSSDFKGTNTSVNVVVDGQTLKAPCKVSSNKNTDGRYEVIIDVSELGLSSGTTVNYTIGEGVIQTKAGTQYNSAYSGSYSIN